MKVIYNKLVPFKGFCAINLFGLCFVRDEYKEMLEDPGHIKLRQTVIDHESIHTAQMRELLYIFFYIIYLLEWVVKLPKYGNKTYDNISFEKEAYAHQADKNYLAERKHFAQWR